MIKKNFIEVIICKNTHEIPDSIFEKLCSLLSIEKQKIIKKFRFKKDANNSLISDLIIRCKAKECLNLQNDNMTFLANKFGKPFLVGYPSFQYNVSHSGNCVAVSFSNKPIGIDIELINHIEINSFRSVLAKEELDYILSSVDKIKRFYEIWTKKESYIKLKGISLVDMPFLNVLEISLDNPVFYYLVFHSNKYMVHTCSYIPEKPKTKIITITDLLKKIQVFYEVRI
ncbi:MAG: 4'-phosphopantetheinyl transferase superfamily protein [Defluviitaleaceae bacterium]|nr:4'-phosphopantetheinyl transferase superfamily protein [Defluviitaleaceae bacterium]